MVRGDSKFGMNKKTKITRAIIRLFISFNCGSLKQNQRLRQLVALLFGIIISISGEYSLHFELVVTLESGAQVAPRDSTVDEDQYSGRSSKF
jgi:hypothetical protein